MELTYNSCQLFFIHYQNKSLPKNLHGMSNKLMLQEERLGRLQHRCLAFLGIFLLFTTLSVDVFAIVESENRVKTAFLYHFCSYVQWPDNAFESPTAPLVIAVAAKDDVIDELREFMSGRQCGKHQITVESANTVQNLNNVHIFYVHKSAKRHMTAVIPADSDLPILTVTDKSLPRSIIHFVIIDKRVRFDIFEERARKAGLQIRSELLSVARNTGLSQ